MNLTGYSVSSEYLCKDSDNGLDFSVKGEVEVRGVIKGVDICLSETRLKEFYCLSKTSRNHKYNECDNGCEEGACIVNETEIKESEETPLENPENDLEKPIQKIGFFKKIINWFKNLF